MKFFIILFVFCFSHNWKFANHTTGHLLKQLDRKVQNWHRLIVYLLLLYTDRKFTNNNFDQFRSYLSYKFENIVFFVLYLLESVYQLTLTSNTPLLEILSPLNWIFFLTCHFEIELKLIF
jgi:hypothetical protein